MHSVAKDFVEYINDPAVSENLSDQQIRASFDARKAVQRRLKDTATNLSNPRIERDRLLARVSVDDCVNAFRQVASSCFQLRRKPAAGSSVESRPRTSAVGSEVWIEVSDPPLCGRLDVSTSNAIVDFKTGQPAETDAEQLVFYALLSWLRTSVVPEKLTLVYTKSGKRVDVQAPNYALLKEMAQSYRAELTEISKAISAANAPPIPSESNCRFCPVRQLCPAYWSAEETALLRLGPQAGTTLTQRSQAWLDVELPELPARSRTSAYLGAISIPGLGVVSISIGSSKIRSPAPRAARLLSALIEQTSDGFAVTAAPNTEVFWIEGERIGAGEV